MSTGGTSGALATLAAPLRRRAALAAVLGVAGGGLGVLGAVAWLARLGVVRSPAWVLGAWLAAVVVAIIVVQRARKAVAALAPAPLADALEATGHFRGGSVRLLLDERAAGTSAGLYGAADARQAALLAENGKVALAGLSLRLGRLVRLAWGAAGAGALLLATAGPLGGTAAALWRPDRAWLATTAPIHLSALPEAVDRGDSVTLSLRATGRREATLWTRATGESWTPEVVALDSLGEATRVIGPLAGDLHAHLTAGGRGSDTVRVVVRLPVFLGSLSVTAEYPDYLGLASEPLPLNGDTLLLPSGTRLATQGRATAPLAEAAWVGPDSVPLDVDDSRIEGRFQPAASGSWQLVARTRDGLALAGDAARIAVRVVPDSAPVIEVPVPGVDTLEPTGATLPLVVDVRDDHGLRRVTLETRRNGEASRVRDLALDEGVTDRALLTLVLELAEFGLLPGDTLRYLVRAADNAPLPNVGRSREFLVVVPTRSALREAQRDAAADAGRQLDSLAARSRALERETEDLTRARPRGAEGRGGEESLSFEEARRAGDVAASQDSLLAEVRELRETLRDLERAAEAAGIADSTFARRLEEIRDELDRALSPELREKLAELQQALRELNAPRTREAMEQLAEAQQRMREALERSRELFERAALEGELGALGQEASELTQAQREWSDSVTRADSEQAAAAERALAERADSLAAGIERAAGRMEDPGARQQMGEAAAEARAAAEGMRQAAQSAQRGQRQQARQQGQQAEARMGEVEQEVGQQREAQQEAWREEVLQALDQALLETTRLTRRQLAVAQAFRRGVPAATLRADQAAVEDGARQLIEQVTAAGGKNALVPPQIAGALAAARQQMAQARGAVATASLNLRDGAERAGEAVDALNVAAFMLLRARSDVSGSSSGSGMAEAMERMAQLAQQQGGIGQDAAGLLPMMSGPGAQQQLQELAARQRQMARDLDRLRAETNAGAAGELAEEARNLARDLESGRLDPATVARQERLFRRMLDAGRTLQGEEEDEQKERESRSGEDIEARLPPALRARLQGGDQAPRLPSWEELQRLSPEERRLVADYFRRIAGGGR